MRLIDADAFDECLKNAEKEATKNKRYVFASALNTIRGNLANAFTIEPQIIRCKDCTWWTNQSTTLQGKCRLHNLNPMPEWYCASGAVVE